MEKSLDQVITEKFAARRGRGNTRGRGNVNRGRVQKNVFNGRNAPRGGGPSFRGRSNFVRGRGSFQVRNSNFQKPIALVTSRHQATQQPMNNLSTKIHVSNLHFEVTEADMRELFGEFGPIKKLSMHYDQHGKSQGVCDIAFEDRAHALRAIKKYENVPLDGRKMRIEVIGELKRAPAVNNLSQQRITAIQPRSHPANRFAPSHRVNKNFVMQRARGNTRGGNIRGRGGNFRGNNRIQNKPQNNKNLNNKTESKTEEQLDKELDSYLAKAPTN